MKQINIAIDGPAGSGKSTTAKLVAKRLHYIFIDTGLMYRALTLYCLVNKIDINDNRAVIKVLTNIRFSYDTNGNIYVNGIKQNSYDLISKKVVNHVSLISAIKAVRTFMVKIQRAIVQGFGYILAGRDIGTAVLPNAQLKVFLTATITKRAQRRVEQARQQGIVLELSSVQNNLQDRDRQDSDRKVSPLKKANDAIEIDNSNLSLDQIVDLIVTMVYEIKKNQCLLQMHS
ncbi:(d)CMP kinase [Spiroplasma endosymbiont of Agriotes lineatus]|uniref:(d)CMP kinase n=1 Tax=Spiroplasma endosymbiont of Agriotes lineatus TaxID=3077930 RepID=UPI0030D277A8